MKKECTYTRSNLPRYLRGHLFRPQQLRIERHLAQCPVCRSEYDSLRQIGETRRILKDITPPESVAGRVKERVSGLSRLSTLLFRPLWLVGIAGVLAAAYIYVINPLLHDPDLESLDASAPPLAAPAPVEPASPEQKKQQPAPAAAPKADPLVITITVESGNEQAGVKRINEAMKEHALLKGLRFSDTVREISGSLAPDELTTLFNRIQDTGKITYKRSRLASAGRGDPLPFVLRLRVLPAHRPAGEPVDKSVEKSVDNAAEKPAQRPGSAPVPRPQPGP